MNFYDLNKAMKDELKSLLSANTSHPPQIGSYGGKQDIRPHKPWTLAKYSTKDEIC